MANLNKTIDIVFGAKDKTGSVFSSVTGRVGSLESSFGGMGGRVAGLTKKLALLATAMGGVSVAFAAFAARGAADFETSIANISTLLSGLAEEDLPEITQGIKELALNMPVELEDLAGAFYDIQSATGAGAAGLDILKVAAMAAVGGLTDTKTAAGALDTVLNSYGLSADNAGKIGDIMFGIVKEGVITFEQLSAGIGKIASPGATANQTFETLGATVATLTGLTGQQAETFTAIRGIFAKLSTKKVEDDFEKLGVKIRDSGGELISLESIIEQVSNKQIKFQQILEIFPEVETANAIQQLTQNYEIYRKKSDEIRKSVGNLDKAFEKMADTFHNKVKVMRNAWSIFLVTVGDPILKELKPIIDDFSDAMKGAEAQAAAGAIGEAFANWIKAISDFTTGLNAAYEKITGIKDSSMLVDFARWAGDIGTIKGSLKVVNTVAGGIAMSVAMMHDAFLGTAQVITVEMLDGLRQVFNITTELLKALDLITPGNFLKGSIEKLEAYAEGFTRDWQEAMKELSGPDLYWTDDVTNKLMEVNDLIEGLAPAYQKGEGEIKTALSGQVSALKDVVDAIKNKTEAEREAAGISQELIENIENAMKTLESGAGEVEIQLSIDKALAGIAKYETVKEQSIENLVNKELDGIDEVDAARQTDKTSNNRLEALENQKQAELAAITELLTAAVKAGDEKLENELNNLATKLAAELAGLEKISGVWERSSETANMDNLLKDIDPAKTNLEDLKKATEALIDPTNDYKDAIGNVTAAIGNLGDTFDSVDTSMESTGNLMESYANNFMAATTPEQTNKIGGLMNKEEQRREKTYQQQYKLTQQQINFNAEKLKRLKSGDALIKISGDNLKPHLQAILASLLEEVRMTANAEEQDFLLGMKNLD